MGMFIDFKNWIRKLIELRLADELELQMVEIQRLEQTRLVPMASVLIEFNLIN